MADAPGSPEFLRVSEEGQSGSKSGVEVLHRTACIGQLVLQFQLACFRVRDALLKGLDDGSRFRLDDPIQMKVDLALNGADFPFQCRLVVGDGLQAMIPKLAEHLASDPIEAVGRAHALQQLLELALDHVTPDGLAIDLTALLRTEIVGMLLAVPSRGPAGRKRRSTTAAFDAATQREVDGEVLTHRRARLAVETIKDTVMRLDTDQCLVIALAKRHIPTRRMDETGIDRLPQNVGDLLIGDFSALWTRESRVSFEETLHFYLKIEATGCIGLQSFSYDRGNRLIHFQQIALTLHLSMPITEWRLEGPVAINDPRPHPVDGLLRVLLTKVLGEGCHQVLAHDAIGIFSELDGRAFKSATHAADGGTQLPVCINASGKP